LDKNRLKIAPIPNKNYQKTNMIGYFMFDVKFWYTYICSWSI